MWVGRQVDEIDPNDLKKKKDKVYSHDNIFHTILGLLEVRTTDYRPELDILTRD
jgi:lipid A ethanolaminephosphotransferase